MALKTMTELPRAMLIDMDDTILSAYSRPDLAWNIVATEFAGELAPLSPQQVAAAIVDSGRKFWATAEAAWRLKLDEARYEVVKGGFAFARCRGPRPLVTGFGDTARRSLLGLPRGADVRVPRRT